jgi:hypothetical protein
VGVRRRVGRIEGVAGGVDDTHVRLSEEEVCLEMDTWLAEDWMYPRLLMLAFMKILEIVDTKPALGSFPTAVRTHGIPP